jgi:hypothetical protein
MPPLKIIFVVLVFSVESLAAQSLSPPVKLCIHRGAAQLLPRIPGLEIRASRALLQKEAQDGVSHWNIEIDVIAAGQEATYTFRCWTGGKPPKSTWELDSTAVLIK